MHKTAVKSANSLSCILCAVLIYTVIVITSVTYTTSARAQDKSQDHLDTAKTSISEIGITTTDIAEKQEAKTDTAKTKIYSTTAFAQIPILHDGRLKPMDSFARAILKELSGSDNGAMEWLLESIFNPAFGEAVPVIKISNPDVLNLLELKKRKSKLFSYREVAAALRQKEDILISISKTPQENWTKSQKLLVQIQQKAITLGDLLGSMGLFLPLAIELPAEGIPAPLDAYTGQTLTYMQILKFRETLDNEVAKIIKDKGNDIQTYTPAEQALSYLAFSAASLRQAGMNSSIFRVIPDLSQSTGNSSAQSTEQNEWQSPWFTILSGKGTPQTTQIFQNWQKLALAYHSNDPDTWNTASAIIYNDTVKIAANIKTQYAQSGLRILSLTTELYYNQIKPFTISIVFYGFALLMLIIAGFKTTHTATTIKASTLFLYIGAVFHFAGIAARVYILSRPPVTTLYESIIFVGLIAVLYGLWAYSKDKNTLWLALASATGIFLHILGFSHDQDGDSFLMLTAVLNTNFWLATHVICITTGYAFCLITSLLAHYNLFEMIKRKNSKTNTVSFKNIHGAALLALLFSATGTVLGGIWADQSWGRFWGWDPKENGALLIVLWLIWVLHGRISGQLKPIWVTAGLAYLSVIVALSWFGVNLLSVGLHAYGFTDSAAWILGGFAAIETIFLSCAIVVIHQREKTSHAH